MTKHKDESFFDTDIIPFTAATKNAIRSFISGTIESLKSFLQLCMCVVLLELEYHICCRINFSRINGEILSIQTSHRSLA